MTNPAELAGLSTEALLKKILLAIEGGGGGEAVWGAITGTLSSQADLVAALNAKLDATAGAGGVLSGNYPNPGFAVNMATQAELDAAVALRALLTLVGSPMPAIQLAGSDLTTAITAGTSKAYVRVPLGFTLTGVRASLLTAQASGNIFTVDINLNGTSVLGTKLTIDNTEKTSTTAATPATLVTTAITDDGEITIDVDQIGNGSAAGLIVTLLGTRA